MEVFEKSETIDPEVRAYVYSLVNALGGSSSVDDTYVIGDDALPALKDLRRWLALYDEKTNRFDVKRCLAEANVVKGDLLEILASWPEEGPLSKSKGRLALGLSCLELLVPLTWPLDLDVNKATVNHHRHAPYLQLAQVAYKQAVLQHDDVRLLRTCIRIALPSMATTRKERIRRDEGIIKLVLYFLRNMTMIDQPQHLPSQVNENDVGRSATIEAFHAQDVFSLLLTICSNMGDEFIEQDVIVLEILFHLLRGIDPRKVFLNNASLMTEETNELSDLLLKEKSMLNSYNKVAPTRHNRFGTMIWVKRDNEKMSTVSGQTYITNEGDTLHHMDASKKWRKPAYRGRQGQGPNDISEFGAQTDLDDKSRGHLRDFVGDFIDSSFNPLFTSLRKAIETEHDRVLTGTHIRQYFYLVSWFLAAESARRENSPTIDSNENCFTYIAAVLDQTTLILLNRQMQAAFDDKLWHELQATLICLTQILHTIQRMSESKDDEDQEIAENMQNRIFYEESTHDRLAQVLRTYAHQGLAYLDAVTDCVHVFVRMLERYSKQNADLQIKSKRKARRKQRAMDEIGKDPWMPKDAFDELEELREAAEEEEHIYRAASERKFDFARFSAKFMSQPCVDTFLALTQLYADLTPAQLKRCHRYFYRLAFKNDLAVFLFRVDILHLFQKMIKGPGGLPVKTPVFKEWEQLIQQIFRRCIKWIERSTQGEGWREVAIIEMLFTKMSGTTFYLQNGYERVIEKRDPRPPAELEVKPSVAEDQRLEVVVSLMIEQSKSDLLDWVKQKLLSVADEKQAWIDEQQARTQSSTGNEDGPTAQAQGPAPSVLLNPETEERKLSCFKDKHLRLLLTTLGLQLESAVENVDVKWAFPSELTPTSLKDLADRISKAQFDPPTFEDEKSAGDLVRPKAAPRAHAVFDDDSGLEDGVVGADLDEAMFPPNLREQRRKRAADEEEQPRKRRRRNHEELTEEELKERAAARAEHEREKNAKIKSRLFVTESDDESDEERDAEFFRLEEERRKATAGLIRSALMKQRQAPAPRKKSKKKGKADEPLPPIRDVDDEEESELSSDEDRVRYTNATRPSRSRVFEETESEDEDSSSGRNYFKSMFEDTADDPGEQESTPSTSPPTAPATARATPPLKEIPANAMSSAPGLGRGVSDGEDEDAPIAKPAPRKRGTRAGFVIDSDSE